MKDSSIRTSDVHWSRRNWLVGNACTAVNVAAIGILAPRSAYGKSRLFGALRQNREIDTATSARSARVAAQSDRIDPGPLQALAQRAVDAARSAGANYADAKITRLVRHIYRMDSSFNSDEELIGIGVRVLVNGYWGFAASPYWEADEVVSLAQDAVGQAKDNGVGSPRRVELGQIPVATGMWTTPIRIDPFTIPIEEKLDYIEYWRACAYRHGLIFPFGGGSSWMQFIRQEWVVATSEGALFTQTRYETGGELTVSNAMSSGGGGRDPSVNASGIEFAGKGWELFLDAKIPGQLPGLKEEIEKEEKLLISVHAPLGRYTLVCDGRTMAALLDKTLGIATQLDRALGYEANAGGTSFIDDPLAMIGHLQVTSPLVTITTNRSAPAQLATVKWDDEGVEPPEATIIKDGVLTDFQTTREQSGWLAPYYQSQGRQVSSNGCAASENALVITMQHMPNLSMEPGKSTVPLEDMVADVKNGLLISEGEVESDFQARNGLLRGEMRMITNGRLRGPTGGAIQFNTLDLWKHINTVGGATTRGGIEVSGWSVADYGEPKGQPIQYTSHSVRAVAATILNQPLIDPTKII